MRATTSLNCLEVCTLLLYKGGILMIAKRSFLKLISIILIIVTCLNCTIVFAHELYYVNGVGLNIRWYDVTNRVAHLKINGNYLNDYYTQYYSSIRSAWPNHSARVSVTETAFGASNVDLATATEQAWINRYEDSYMNVWGHCRSVTTNGYDLETLENAQASSKRINYSAILYTPYIGTYGSETHLKKTMVHEIGHALGLGHPDGNYSYTSVMYQGPINTYWLPQTHDINDLNNKYQ